MNMGVRTRGTMAAINVTPMADIMIVLLIIFMVMTPFLGQGRVENLPEAENTTKKNDDPSFVISLSRELAISLGTTRLATGGELLALLQERLAVRPEGDRVVYLRADRSLPYAEVHRIMDVCRDAGADQLALIAAPRVGSERRRPALGKE